MTNTQGSEARFSSRGTQSFPATDAPGRPGARHGQHNLSLALVAISIAAATVGGVQDARLSSRALAGANTSRLAAGVGAMAAYQQGGSVYTEQVPGAATHHAYGTGGSVYTEQVPSLG